MGLAGRSTRRGATGFRWLAVGVVITLLVLLIDASLKSTSPTRAQQLATGAWMDRVLAVISSSNDQGKVIAGIWSNGLKTAGPALASSIDAAASGAAANYAAVAELRPPDALLGSAGLLEAALLARSDAASELRGAFDATLGSAAGRARGTAGSTDRGPTPTSSHPATAAAVAPVGAPPSSQIGAVTSAGNDIQVGDSAYRLFQQSLPPGIGVQLPNSAWGSDMSYYTPQAATVFLTSLQSAVATSPVHQLRIYSVSLSPSPVSSHGPTQVLPDARSVYSTIVVADTGNQTERNVTVTASISPAGSGTSSVRDFVDLSPGQAYTISGLGPLQPPQGPTVTLTVTATAPSGSPTPPVTSTLGFSMPAPPTTTTTTGGHG